MKRLFCFILILLLLIPSAMAEEPKATFRIEDAKGNVGDTVTVIGAVENFPTCASFRVILTYDSSVLKPDKVKKLDCGGLFMSNANFSHKGAPAINVLSADSKKSFEGTKQLFSITFQIIGESPEKNGSPIKLAHKEFFDPSTPKPLPINPTIELGKVYVGDDQPGENQPENNEGTNPDQGVTNPDQGVTNPDQGVTNPDQGTTNPDQGVTNPDQSVTNPDQGVTNPDQSVTNPDQGTTNPDQPATDLPADGTVENPGEEIVPGAPEGETPEAEKAPADNAENKEDSKKPTGSWIVDQETEDIYHVDEEGNDTVFKPEYVEKPAPGVVTDVILKNPETGKEEGSIKVEIQEDGSLEVLEQDVPSLREDAELSGDSAGNHGGKSEKVSVWVWIGIGAGTLALAGIAIWVFYTYRKLK